MEKKLICTVISVITVAFALTLGAQVGGGDIVMKNSGGDTTFSHERHAGKGLTCEQCHPEPYMMGEKHKTVSMKEMEKGASCGLCHNGKPVFTVKGNCTTCHKKQEGRIMFEGKDGAHLPKTVFDPIRTLVRLSKI